MYKSSTEIKVGVFVLVALLGFIFMAVRLGGLDLSRTSTYRITTVFPSAAGLKPGVAVEVAGIQVGTVSKIELYDENQAKVSMAIQEGIRLPLDSAAHIKASGILGDKYVELMPGNSQDRISSGGEISTVIPATDMDNVMQQLGEIAADIKKITTPLAEGNTGSDLKEMVSNLKDMSERLGRILNANEGSLGETLSALNTSMSNLQEITTKINQGKGSLGQLINSDSTVDELNRSLASIRHIAERIEAGEGTLGRLVNDDSTIEKVDQALSHINTYLEKDDKYKVYVEYRSDYLTRHDYLKSTVNVKLQSAPDRYYLLGVTGDYFGQYKRTDRHYTDSQGNRIESKDEQWRRDKLKFNAQIARRFYDVVIRGGLIESGAGLGVDYYLADDNLRLTFEAFSSDFDHNPHLRAEASYNIWKIFYFNVGYDDFISDQHRASPYFGIGLQFNDDDLKDLLKGASSVL